VSTNERGSERDLNQRDWSRPLLKLGAEDAVVRHAYSKKNYGFRVVIFLVSLDSLCPRFDLILCIHPTGRQQRVQSRAGLEQNARTRRDVIDIQSDIYSRFGARKTRLGGSRKEIQNQVVRPAREAKKGRVVETAK
jgi:hypothetical protein